MTACVQIKVRCGSENFEAGIALAEDLCTVAGGRLTGYDIAIKDLIHHHAAHCKSGLVDHIKTTSKCSSHCLTHLLGGQGVTFSNECPESCSGHPERCKQCETGQVILKMLENMITKLSHDDIIEGDVLEDMQWRLQR